MKTKYGADWISVNNETDNKMIKYRLMDNGYWEYDRMAVGEYKGKVFIVDVDDTGETWREMLYCSNVKSADEVIKIGIETGVFEDYGDRGYGKNDIRVKEEADQAVTDKFSKLIGCQEPKHDYYSTAVANSKK